MRLVISNASPKPIYEQITDQLRRQIVAGELSEGEALPSIRRLARELSVSVITTKRAYEDLEREGFIDSVAGKGTFVAAQSDGFLQEKKRAAVEGHLSEAVDVARRWGVERDEVHRMIDLFWEEEE